MIWKKIKQNENYSINELGEVRNDLTGALKKAYTNAANGYNYVDLWAGNKSTKCAIHRLLAEAFIPNPDGKPTVDHKDGDRQNNSLQNLRWATYAEQNSRFNSTGVRSQKVKVTHYAEKRKKRGGGHEAWLDADGIMYFDRITDAADYFGLTIGSISLLLKDGNIGRRGKTRGYRFEYLDGSRVQFHERVTTTETAEESETE
jgi:hypothetical protein